MSFCLVYRLALPVNESFAGEDRLLVSVVLVGGVCGSKVATELTEKIRLVLIYIYRFS